MKLRAVDSRARIWASGLQVKSRESSGVETRTTVILADTAATKKSTPFSGINLVRVKSGPPFSEPWFAPQRGELEAFAAKRIPASITTSKSSIRT